jgi:hypothetical protein
MQPWPAGMEPSRCDGPRPQCRGLYERDRQVLKAVPGVGVDHDQPLDLLQVRSAGLRISNSSLWIERKSRDIGVQGFGKHGDAFRKSNVAAITEAKPSKSVFLWVVTICIPFGSRGEFRVGEDVQQRVHPDPTPSMPQADSLAQAHGPRQATPPDRACQPD